MGTSILFFVIILFTTALLIAFILSKERVFLKTIGYLFVGVLGLVVLLEIVHWFNSKTELDKEDFYGDYVINRDYFKGTQTDWQYNTFRFEITEQDSLLFHITDQEKIVKTYRGIIKTTDPENYRSQRLMVEMNQPTHHILTTNPTIYRSSWSFYLVFNSPKFNNVFFKKGKWEPIEQ